MSKTFYFRCHTGPTIVNQTVGCLRDAGIDANAGTEHAYGNVRADSPRAAADKLNRAAGYKLCTGHTPTNELREVHGGGGASAGARAKRVGPRPRTKADLARLRRPSPTAHAADHKNECKRGHDRHLWCSTPDKNGVYRWRRV